jgi:hypothetical protein
MNAITAISAAPCAVHSYQELLAWAKEDFAAALRFAIHYDPRSGAFTRRVSFSTRGKVGERCERIVYCGGSEKAYAKIFVAGKVVAAHRAAFLYMTGAVPEQVDHDDGNGLNNKWRNLKASSNAENSKNQRLRKTNTSGCHGVSWHKKSKQWVARITVNGKQISLGYRKEKSGAIALRKAAELVYGFSEAHGKERPVYGRDFVAAEWGQHQARLAQEGAQQ